jgi:electron transfer flavoprotein alpha subunit
MGVLIIAEHDNQVLQESTLNAVTAALEIDADVSVLVAGKDCGGVVESVAKIKGVSRVLTCEHEIYEHQLAESLAGLIVSIAGDYSHILAAATSQGKNVLPRAAALLDVAPISDITDVLSSDTFVRPIYAGNAIATVQSLDPIKVVTIRPTTFEAAAADGGSAEVITIDAHADSNDMSNFVGQELTRSERPELTSARIVISGGRGMGSADNFQIIEALADKLNAAVGASRAAVDAGYVPNDYQVGQTGKVVAPDLYIAVGISGAIQHLAGMKDSKVIVAINKDEEAPIFQVADYGIVADLFDVVPKLTEAVQQ